MKHTFNISIVLVIVFLLSQIVGLSIIGRYVDADATEEAGEIQFKGLPYDLPRPETEGGGSAVTTIIAAILIGTVLVFLIMKFGEILWWKIWFFMAVSFCLLFAFSAFIPSIYASILAIALAAFKIFKPNLYAHNVSELFTYGGLAVLIVPLFNNPQTNIFWAFALLILISIYDMISVWKSKHMIKLAKFQTKSQVFAGMLIPYKMPKKVDLKATKEKLKRQGIKTAILGGGDMGFPLFFTGIVMLNLIQENLINGVTNFVGAAYLRILVVPVFVSLSLWFLLTKSKKNTFYPAMPFLTVGCTLGYIALLLINLI